ncbi:MAG TPA: hypothetical protein VFW98_03790 [Gemmatimonadaceae bacterium]|nr:hypothetical protein [Gemmatimonadaceae bacterium]
MFVELVGSLRCIQPHELTWLVASVSRIEQRDILVGTLGCHVCHATYPIADGVADFTVGAPGEVPASEALDAAAADALSVRAAALLDLATPGGVAVLMGAWGICARPLAELVPQVHLFLLNAPPGIRSGAGVSLANVHDDVPLRPGAARGIALDEPHTTPELVEAAVQTLRPRGRLLAPVSLPVPAGITELARDERSWVGVKEVRPQIVQLQGGRAGR